MPVMEEKKLKDEKLREKAAEISIVEGSAASVMDGFGSKYITPYALALGATNTHIGLLSALPQLLGTISQLFGSRAIEKHSRKKILLWFVTIQAILWLPLIAVGIAYFFFGLSAVISSVLVIVLYTILSVAGSFVGPAWSSWMKDIVINADSYFGRRSKVCGIVGLLSTGIAGLVLYFLTPFNVFAGFAIILFVAFLGRSFYAYMFTKKYEPKLQHSEGYYFSFWQFLRKMSSNNFGRFAIFWALVSFSTAVASPFFVVYELKNLGLNYFAFTMILVAPIITTLLTIQFWGRLIERYGNVAIFKFSGYLIWVIPALWVLTIFMASLHTSFVVIYLILVESFSGIVWAGFNLATWTFMFHAITRERLALISAYTGILNSLGAFIGATLGGALSSFSGVALGISGIVWIFILSALLRFLSVTLFVHRIKEVREVVPAKNLNRIFLSEFIGLFWLRRAT